MIQLLKKYVLTEKSCRLMETNQYTFDVDLKLTKADIKKLMKDMFNVDVLSVNTHRPPRKKKGLGMSKGYKSSMKRVIVKIKSDSTLFSNSSDSFVK